MSSAEKHPFRRVAADKRNEMSSLWPAKPRVGGGMRGDGILELLTCLTAANLDGMHIETPIRAGNAPGKARPPLSRESPGQRENAVAHAWNNRSQLNESAPRVSNGHGSDREERLLRLVDILRTEQVSSSIVTNVEVNRKRLHRRLGPCLLAAVVILMGAAAILHASRSTRVFSDARTALPPEPGRPIQSTLTTKIGLQPQPRVETGDTGVSTDKPINPSLIAPFPEGFAQGHSLPPPPIIEQQAAATSLDGSITETKSVDLPTPKHDADSLASQPLAAMAGDVSDSKTDKPALVVYFPRGSLRAEANARSLSSRITTNLAKSDFEAQSDLPDDAIIKFSEESNHKLARLVGKSLGDSGYRWRIENASTPVGAHRNTIEVWLPR
jgi:hypothetical protein